MKNQFSFGHIEMNTGEIFPINCSVIDNTINIYVNQREEEIEFKLFFCEENRKISVNRCIANQATNNTNINYIVENLGHIDLNNRFIGNLKLSNKKLQLRSVSQKIIVAIAKYVFFENAVDIPKGFKLIIKVDGDNVRSYTPKISNENSVENSNINNLCFDCVERNDCFIKDKKTMECEHYKAGPIDNKDYWPTEMGYKYYNRNK